MKKMVIAPDDDEMPAPALPLYDECEKCGGVTRLMVGPDVYARWHHYPALTVECPVS
jgi:hypothetical protein